MPQSFQLALCPHHRSQAGRRERLAGDHTVPDALVHSDSTLACSPAPIPVGMDGVCDALADLEPSYAITGVWSDAAKMLHNGIVDLVVKRGRIVGEVEPDQPFPNVQGHG